MILTKEGIRKKCVIVDKITDQKYFLKKEGNYLTIYKRNEESLEVLIEILLEGNLNMPPEKFWGLVEKETKGEEIYITAKELNKIDDA